MVGLDAVGMVVILLAAAMKSVDTAGPPAIVTIDVAADYGTPITFAAVGAAMRRAIGELNAGKSCTVLFAAGTHHIELPGPLFNVTGVAAVMGGRLTIAGAGMLLTTLNLTTHGNDVIQGREGTQRLTVRDVTFARPAVTTAQGRLLNVTESTLTLQVDPGFPQLDALLVDRIPRLDAEQGLFVRRYRTGFADGAHVVTDCNESDCPWPGVVNAQVHFTCGGDGAQCPNMVQVAPSVWQLRVAKWPPGEQARYAADIDAQDAVVGVKIKHGGQAYNIRSGNDIAFISVRWLGHSRGILYHTDNVRLENTVVARDPSMAAFQVMATPGGGPQVNTCNNLTVVNHTAVATGDDALGLFHITTGSVRGSHIRDSFARGILLCNVTDAFAANVVDNAIIRCPVWRPPNTTHVNTC